MVRVDGGIAANLAGALDQITARERTLHGNVSEVFFGMPPSPVCLPGIRSQVELVHAASIPNRSRFVNPLPAGFPVREENRQ
jgi:hypothetical protein